ncbi:MAG: urease subunit beta [Alphaproteobacteria bacterium]|nr:MAG: urease subunit beta [Alphaproteobacteria bacterium]
MIPGEYLIIDGSLEINSESNTITIEIINEGDRPIQVGSHFHFAEVNAFLKFDRKKAKGTRLNIASGTSIRFEPGQKKIVDLVYYKGKKNILGFNNYN